MTIHTQRVTGSTALCLATALGITSPAAAPDGPAFARRADAVRVHQGIEVPEPYGWMEDMGSRELRSWMRAQDEYARAFIARIGIRDEILKQMVAGANHERYLTPIRRGGRFFYARVNSSFTRITLLVRRAGGDGERILVDAGTEERAGRMVDRSFWPSPDGRFLAYGVLRPGSRWMEIRFRDVQTGQELPDRLQGLQGARLSRLSWQADGSGVWYDAFDLPPEENRQTAKLTGSKVAFHRLGTPQTEDTVLMRAADDDELLLHTGTDEGRWVAVNIFDEGQFTRLIVLDARHADREPIVLVDRADKESFSVIGSRGDHIWVHTTRGAPNGRAVGIPVHDPAPAHWEELIPEQDEAIDTWVGVDAVGDGLIAGFRRNGLLELRYFEPATGAAKTIPLARIGSIWFGVSGRQGDPRFHYLLSGFADPGTVYSYDLRSERTEEVLRPHLGYDLDTVVTRQVFYSGPAGDRIPMYIAHHRDAEPNGKRPVIMYGYGALNWSASPWFRAHLAEWFRMGGVFALPAIRGGGEFGGKWAEAGIRRNRQNAINDFIAAGKWLIAEGFVDPPRLIAESNSAGASAVGAAIVQHPDLFGAALLGFPLLDMVNYHRFTGARRWISQFGTVERPEEARALITYSPIHNVRTGRCYPATFVTPGELDETTPPFHAYKFVAALQHAQACKKNPILLRMAWGAGHAYGKDQPTTLENFADQIAFLRQVLPEDTAWRARSPAAKDR